MTDNQVSALLSVLASAMPDRSVAARMLRNAAMSVDDCGLESVIDQSRKMLADPTREQTAEGETAVKIVLAVATFEPSEHE